MRFYKLVTLGRRGGLSFILKDACGRNVLGTMVLNSRLVRHEMEMDEPTYLKHAKALAQLCQFPGAAVYVAEIRDDAPARAPEVLEFEAGYNLAMDGRPLPDGASQAARAGWDLVKTKPPLVTVIDHAEGEAYTDKENFDLGFQLGLDGLELKEFADIPECARGYRAALEEVSRRTKKSNESTPLADIHEKTPHFSLVAAAKREGVDISQCKTRAERVKAILDARTARVESTASSEPSAFAQL